MSRYYSDTDSEEHNRWENNSTRPGSPEDYTNGSYYSDSDYYDRDSNYSQQQHRGQGRDRAYASEFYQPPDPRDRDYRKFPRYSELGERDHSPQMPEDEDEDLDRSERRLVQLRVELQARFDHLEAERSRDSEIFEKQSARILMDLNDLDAQDLHRKDINETGKERQRFDSRTEQRRQRLNDEREELSRENDRKSEKADREVKLLDNELAHLEQEEKILAQATEEARARKRRVREHNWRRPSSIQDRREQDYERRDTDQEWSTRLRPEEAPRPRPPPPPYHGAPRSRVNRLYHDSDAKSICSDLSDEDWENNGMGKLFEDVERAGLSINLPVNKNSNMITTDLDAQGEGAAAHAETVAWKDAKAFLPDGTLTELHVIQASEFSVDEKGIGRVVLVCPEGPRRGDNNESAVHMRWLHVQRPALNLKIIERLVHNCPFIPEDLMSVALLVLEQVQNNLTTKSESGGRIEPGSVLRCIGRYPSMHRRTGRLETDPVVFLSSPHLTIQATSRHASDNDDGYRPQTLLQSLYGYDATDEGDRGHIMQKMLKLRSNKDALHISQLWCLLIGPSILITFSDQPAEKLRGESITIDSRAPGNGEPLIVQLISENMRRYNISIEPDYNYVDFLRHAVALVRGNTNEASEFELFEPDDSALTPKKWIQILTSSTSQLHIFYVKAKRGGMYGDISSHFGESGQRARPSYSDALVLRQRMAETVYRPRQRKSSYSERDTRERSQHSRLSRSESVLGKELVLRKRSTRPATPPHGKLESRLSPLQDIDKHQKRKAEEREDPYTLTKPTGSLASGPRRDSVQLEEDDGPLLSSKSDTISATSSTALDNVDQAPTSKKMGDNAVEETSKSQPRKVERHGQEELVSGEEPSSMSTSHQGLFENQEITRSEQAGNTNSLEDSRDDCTNPNGGLDQKLTEIDFEREPSDMQLVLRSRRRDTLREHSAQTEVSHSREEPDSGPKRLYVAKGWDEMLKGQQMRTAHPIEPPIRSKPRFEPQPRRRSSGFSNEDEHRNKETKRDSHGKSKALVLRARSGDWTRESLGASGTRQSPFRSDTHVATAARHSAGIEPPIERQRHVSSRGRAHEIGLVVNDHPNRRWQGPELFELGNASGTDSEITGRDTDESEDTDLAMPTSQSQTRQNVANTERKTASKRRGPEARTGSWSSSRYRRSSRSPSHSPSTRRDRQISPDSLERRRDRPKVTKRSSKPEPVKERAVRFEDVPEELTTGAGKSQTERLPVINFVPFFTWRVGDETAERSPEEVDTMLIKVLSQLHKSLSSDVIGNVTWKLYSRTLTLTMQDLLFRHDTLQDLPSHMQPILTPVEAVGGGIDSTRTTSGQTVFCMQDIFATHAESAACKKDKQEKIEKDIEPGQDSTGETGSISNSPKDKTSGTDEPAIHETSEKDPESTKTTPDEYEPADWRQQHSIGVTGHDKMLMKQLLEISQEILWAFTPKEGSPLIHNVCIRFWGAVDCIFRQLAWEESDRGPTAHRQYTIRDFETHYRLVHEASSVPTAQKKSWSDCAECKAGKSYPSATAALEHVHKEHLECTGNAARPYNDPCFVWLRRVWTDGYQMQTPGMGMLHFVEDFIKSLLPINNSIKELHILVANAQNAQPQGREIPRPCLPRNLVYVFQQIISMYVLESQWLSLHNRLPVMRMNDEASSRIAYVEHKITELLAEEDIARQKAHDLLEDAKRDIILLGNTSRNIDSLGVEAVGAEFLVLSLVCAGQNMPLRPLAESTTLQGFTFIELYRDRTSKLRFQAHRRPQKRVFLHIHALEEELEALRGLVKAQKLLMIKYLKVISPKSFRITNTTRIGQYRTEDSMGRFQLDQLIGRGREIDILKAKSKSLKEEVKQTLEILEEDHGKAIRVFTIVTLFFLPLSFVSSFMGMNTTDIRDTEFTQRIFWTTATPVTAAVLALAFLYGYKGDQIGGWLERIPQYRDRNRLLALKRRGNDGGGLIRHAGELGGPGSDAMARDENRRIFHVDSDPMTGRFTTDRRRWRHAAQPSNGYSGLRGWVKNSRNKVQGL